MLKLFLLIALFHLDPVSGQCHNLCSGHGTCDLNGVCSCFDSYTGADCSLRECPTAFAWVDYAVDNQQAHQLVECANRGHCNRKTALCQCEPGYYGGACQRSHCPNNCNFHGRCLSMSEAAESFDGYKLNHSFTSYKSSLNGGTQWDADMIYGCVCDYGFTGYDCSEKECDVGDDIRTEGQTHETATLYCRCPSVGGCGAIDSTSTFRLSYMGHKTRELYYNSTNTSLANAILELPSMHTKVHRTFDNVENGHETVLVSFDAGQSSLCSESGTTTTIQLLRESGDLPPFVILQGSTSPKEARIVIYFITTQTLTCACGGSGGSCEGTFSVGLDGLFTDELSASGATASTLQNALTDLPPFKFYESDASLGGDPVITVVTANKICRPGVSVESSIEMRLPVGNQPALTLTSSLISAFDNTSLTIATNDGTSERAVCNAGGTCNYATGECMCDEFRTADSDFGECGAYNIETSAWTGLERCAGYVDFVSNELVQDYNTPYLFYTDDGANNTAANINDTAANMGITDDDGSPLRFSDITPTRREIKDRGIMLLNMDTKEFRCIHNLTNGSSSIGVDLSYKHLYAANDKQIIRLTLPSHTEQLLYEDPNSIVAEKHFVNLTFIKNLTSPVGTLTLDLRLDHRHIYWTQPGKFGEWDGKIMKASLEDVSVGGEAKNIVDLTPIINAGLKDITIAGTSMQTKVKGGLHNPTGIALDLRKPNLRMYWLDTGTNISTSPNNTGTYRDGRLFRSNLDGTKPEIVLDYGYLKNPTGLVLDLINNTAFVGDEAGQIWGVDMDFLSNENQNVSRVLNKPELLFTGPIGYGDICPSCDTGVRIKSPTAFALDYRDRELFKTDPLPVVETMFLYWTDVEAGVIARATYSITRATQLGSWGAPIVFKHLQQLFGNTRPRGLALDLGFGVPRGGQGVYECFGHGTCGGVESSFRCTCVDGWFGNCNMATCPSAPAWFDEAWADNRAHRPVECSQQGLCDRTTGTCMCADGFYGSACQFQKCVPESTTPCNGHGRCKSIRDIALDSTYNGEATPYEYGASTAPVVGQSMDNSTMDQVWDADVVHGCTCDISGYVYQDISKQREYRQINANDNTGGTSHSLQNGTEFFGYDCSLRKCPPGDDPKTVNVNKTFEVQNFTCASTNGTFALSFRSQTTNTLECNSTSLANLEHALESLVSIGDVAVTGRWTELSPADT